MNKREYVFFDNYETDYLEIAREDLNELYGEDYDATESEIFDRAATLEDIDWDDAKRDVDALLADNVVVTGTVGRWDGNYDGGRVYSFRDVKRGTLFENIISDIGQDCIYFEIKLSGGVVHVKCTHHDGTNIFEIRNLTEAGYRAYDGWNYSCRFANLSDREFFTRLVRSRTWTKRIVA